MTELDRQYLDYNVDVLDDDKEVFILKRGRVSAWGLEIFLRTLLGMGPTTVNEFMTTLKAEGTNRYRSYPNKCSVTVTTGVAGAHIPSPY